MSLQTEFPFTLPKGYVDGSGQLHRTGSMRLGTAADEIEPQRDPRVKENDAFASVILLARTVTNLGTVSTVTTNVIENLFVADFNYLQDFYTLVNFGDVSILDSMEPGAPFPLVTAGSG